MKDINVVIERAEKLFNAVDREKLRDINLIAESSEILIERSEQTLSRSSSDTRMVA